VNAGHGQPAGDIDTDPALAGLVKLLENAVEVLSVSSLHEIRAAFRSDLSGLLSRTLEAGTYSRPPFGST
jgi:hypothetical protein